MILDPPTTWASIAAGAAAPPAKRPMSSTGNKYQQQWCHAPPAAATAIKSGAMLPRTLPRHIASQINNAAIAAHHHRPMRKPNVRSTAMPHARAQSTITSG